MISTSASTRFSRGVLAMTVACARCHDHKFDPILTKDIRTGRESSPQQWRAERRGSKSIRKSSSAISGFSARPHRSALLGKSCDRRSLHGSRVRKKRSSEVESGTRDAQGRSSNPERTVFTTGKQPGKTWTVSTAQATPRSRCCESTQAPARAPT